jgi:superfamily II DNA or RNA helicase
MSNINDFLKYLTNLPQVERGRVFEVYCKWFLENDPIYASQLKRVWLWKDWPGNWGRDKGIDLIAETHRGEFWAIQAKCYDKNYYVTKEDVDKFLSESSRANIAYRLLICTTDLLGDNAREVIAGQEKQVGICSLENLLNSSLEWPTSIENLKPQTIRQPKTPRPHQEKAISAVLEGFKNHEKGQLYMACGTGKTLVGLWLAEGLKSQNTLVLVPSISLVSQLYQEWAANATTSFIPIFVCSDPTVNEKDQMVTSLYELGFPTTTDAREILSYFSSTKDIPKVIFSTYHSSPVIKKVCALDNSLMFDLTVADEAHRCAGAASSDFATIFEPGAIRTRHKLFMTATPKIFSEHVKTKAKELEYEILSMDDDKKFGPVFHKLPFSEAITQDLLSDYEVLISVMDNATYREYAEKGRFVAIANHETDARTVASQLLISKAIKQHSLQRLITFHSKKSNAHEFIDTFPQSLLLVPSSEQPNIGFYGTIFGEMQQTKRKSIMNLFKDLEPEKSGILANVRCLSEGVDVPTLDGIAFIDPKGSEIDIIQAVGRAIRKAPNKKIGRIIIPIFIDKDEDATLNLEQSCFKPVWKVLNALRAHDDIFAEELDHLRLELGRRTYRQPPKLGKITIDLPISIGTEFSDSLKLKIVDKCSTNWEFYYGLIMRYIEENGKAPTNTEIQYYGYNLGSWISIQRRNYNSKELNASYIKRLESLPGWAWDALEAYWLQGFELLKGFFQNNGHLNVPFNYCIGDFKLNSWMSVQRRAHKNKKMSPERQVKLESIPGWSWKIFDALWEKGFLILLAFYEREKHLNVPAGYTEQSLNLGTWIRNRKKDFELGKLSSDKQEKLENIPAWTWESDLDVSWKKAFLLLQRFTEETGHARVPQGHKYNEFNLDSWVSTQRRAYLLGKLSENRKTQLTSLPGWTWNTINQRDEAAFQAIDSFVQREGHAFIPTNHIENKFNLGKWISRQRLYYTQGNLEEKFKLKLESYPDWYWNANEGYWERGRRYLIQFCQREGHGLVKNTHIENRFDLGKWVQMYRYQNNQNKLSKEKVDFFNSLPNWSWDVKGDQWKLGLQYLKKYIAREGHSGVPAGYVEDEFTLGTWVCTQRYAYSQKKLTIEKIDILESLSGWCWDKIEFEWRKGYTHLKEFTASYGHANVPAKHKNNDFSLGIWIQSQRSNYKCAKLSTERIALLEALEGWIWDPKEAKWEEAYKRLLNFCVKEGHSLVPPNHIEDGLDLREWISTQRKSYKAKKISEQRIEKLESIIGWVWDTREQ